MLINILVLKQDDPKHNPLHILLHIIPVYSVGHNQ
jgi:hypothetical protein